MIWNRMTYFGKIQYEMLCIKVVLKSECPPQCTPTGTDCTLKSSFLWNKPPQLANVNVNAFTIANANVCQSFLTSNEFFFLNDFRDRFIVYIFWNEYWICIWFSGCFFPHFGLLFFILASYSFHFILKFSNDKNLGVYTHRLKLLFVPLAWKHIHLMLWHTKRPAMKKLPKKNPFTLSSLKINAVSLNHKIYAATYECWAFTIVGSYLSVSFCQPACPSVTRLCLNVMHTINTGRNCYVRIATAANVQDVRDDWIIKSFYC